MSLKNTRKKAAEKAREIDHERQEVLRKLFFARSEVAQLEITARELEKEHLKAVHSVFRIEDMKSNDPPDPKDEQISHLKKAIFEAFHHLEMNPFEVPNFYQARAVVIWWVCREIQNAKHTHLFKAWQGVVGAQETSSYTAIRGIIRQVEEPTNHIVKEYKEKITGQVLSGTHPKHQESKEPGQSRN
jgi:hypothetical protein